MDWQGQMHCGPRHERMMQGQAMHVPCCRAHMMPRHRHACMHTNRAINASAPLASSSSSSSYGKRNNAGREVGLAARVCGDKPPPQQQHEPPSQTHAKHMPLCCSHPHPLYLDTRSVCRKHSKGKGKAPHLCVYLCIYPAHHPHIADRPF